MNQTDNFDRGGQKWSTTQERNRDSLHDWCELALGLQTIRGRWKPSILIALSENITTIPQLQDRLSAVNRRVLVRALRELEADGLISRTTPDKTVYALTEEAKKLVNILHELAQWQVERQENKK